MIPSGLAVVTGAASGIGRELAFGLAARGNPLLIVDRDGERLLDVRDSITRAHAVVPEHLVCDLSDSSDRVELEQRLRERKVEVLCNDAGFGTFGPFSDTSPDVLHAQTQLHVIAMQQFASAVLPRMLQQRAGAILFVGSIAGDQPVPQAACYAACKAFVNSLAESLHQELAGTGVTCTLLAPGPVDTRFDDTAGVVAAGAAIPEVLWTSAADAAEAGLAALARGRRRITPGLPSRVLAFGGRHSVAGVALPVIDTVIRRGLARDGSLPALARHGRRTSSSGLRRATRPP